MPMQVRLPHAEPRQLVDRFVGERAALRHDADAAFLADVAGDDAGLGLARRDEAGAIRADEPRRRALLEERHRAHHVERRNALGDADDERDAGVGRFHHRVGGERRRHEDDRRVRAGLLRPRPCTVSKIGQPSCVVPPLPGVTPPTTVVP